MTRQTDQTLFLAAPQPAISLWQRALHMAGLWLCIGAVVGFGIGAARDGVISVVANVLAGVIVMPVLGVLLALLGGRVRPTLIGGICGGAAGAAAGLSGDAAGYFWANAGLIAGATAGATLPTILAGTALLLRTVRAYSPVR
jgi:hypothetical protein